MSHSPHHICVLLELIDSANCIEFYSFLLDALKDLDIYTIRKKIAESKESASAYVNDKIDAGLNLPNSEDKVIEDAIFDCLKKKFNFEDDPVA